MKEEFGIPGDFFRSKVNSFWLFGYFTGSNSVELVLV